MPLYLLIDLLVQHLQGLVDHLVNVGEVLQSEATLSLGLVRTGYQQVAIVGNTVVTVLVQRTQ